MEEEIFDRAHAQGRERLRPLGPDTLDVLDGGLKIHAFASSHGSRAARVPCSSPIVSLAIAR
jgi:hypothetical protein